MLFHKWLDAIPGETTQPAAERRDSNRFDIEPLDIRSETPETGIDILDPAFTFPMAFCRKIDNVLWARNIFVLEYEHFPGRTSPYRHALA